MAIQGTQDTKAVKRSAKSQMVMDFMKPSKSGMKKPAKKVTKKAVKKKR